MSASEFVLDAYALLVFLQKEPGWGRVETLLKRAANDEVVLHISALNFAEVQCYVTRRVKETSQILAALEAMPVKVASADAYLQQAADIRGKYGLSFGNCFAAALAQDTRLPLVTGDPAFRKLGSAVNIEWLR